MTEGRRFGAVCFGAALALLAAGPSAHGAEPVGAEQKAAAQVLFDEARKLTEGGDLAAACPKFIESHRLDPSMGTKFYLADCLERTGKIATAWSYYVEVTDAARAVGLKERETYARERAEALKPKLSTLVVTVHEATRGLAGLVVKRDGIDVGEAQWGIAVPTDPGEHVVSATAPGKKRWEKSITVTMDPEAIAVEVPLLEADKAPDLPVQRPPPPPPASFWSVQRIAGIGAGVAGAVGVGLGAFFGLQAMSKQDESNESGHCDAQDRCDDAGLALRSEAIDAATISTIGFIAGGVALAGGAVLFLTAPSSTEVGSTRTRVAPAQAQVVVGPRGIAVLGRF